MPSSATTVSRTWPYVVPLVIQNLIIFHGHYFGEVGFPWDFSMSYYAMVAFWTAGIGQGVFPQWVPFQQLGYPFALQIQSGINYLPLWIFPATTLPYTLRAAIIVQCLHVLVGAIGMFVLARHLQGSRKYALLAAIGFQFFGGFYSNAEHPDIVRAFAFTPWLLYVFTIGNSEERRIPGRVLLLPIVLSLFLTGAYPGNVIAAGIVIPLFLILQLLDVWLRGAFTSTVAARVAAIAGMSGLGVGMAFLHFAPVALFRDQFFRGQPLDIPRFTLWVEHLPSLFLSNRLIPGEISMTSAYVSLPMLLLAAFVTFPVLRRYWVYLVIAVVAVLMAAGDHVPLGMALRRAVPSLNLSRFPSSDYRAFIAVPLLLCSILGLRVIVERQLSLVSMAVRGALGLAFVTWGLSRLYPMSSVIGMVTIAIALATLVAVAWLARARRPLTVTGLTVVAALVVVDAVRVLPDMHSWNQPRIDEYYEQQGWPAYTRNRGRRLVASSVFRNTPESRPERIEPRGLVRWSGYSDGRYYTSDLTPNVLRATAIVQSNPLYQSFMLREWLPVLLDSTASSSSVPAAIAARVGGGGEGDDGTVRQTRYGVNDITYDVALSRPRVLVENEIYFPGWRASLSTPGGDVIDARPSEGVFRTWSLPAGQYTMTVRFEFPYLTVLRLVSAVSFALWLGVCFLWRSMP